MTGVEDSISSEMTPRPFQLRLVCRLAVIHRTASVSLTSVSRAQEHVWCQVPTPQLLEKTPGLTHRFFESEWMPDRIGYSVVLPASCDSDHQRRYPVIDWLHGGGGNECSHVWTFWHWKRRKARRRSDFG